MFIIPQHDPFQRVMEANCLYNLSLADYAKMLNLSLSSFKRHFISVYKTTPGHWLQEQKLNHAYKLIVCTGKPITDISFESGFKKMAESVAGLTICACPLYRRCDYRRVFSDRNRK